MSVRYVENTRSCRLVKYTYHFATTKEPIQYYDACKRYWGGSSFLSLFRLCVVIIAHAWCGISYIAKGIYVRIASIRVRLCALMYIVVAAYKEVGEGKRVSDT